MKSAVRNWRASAHPVDLPGAELSIVAGVFYLVGAAMALLAAFDPASPALAMVAFGAVCVGVGIAALLLRRRFTVVVSHATSIGGIVLITAAALVAGGGWASAVVVTCYAFVTVHAALVLPRIWVVAYVLAMALAGTGVAMVIAPEAAVPAGLVVVLVCGSIAATTAFLVGRLQVLATTDPLTGAHNRAAFHVALSNARATVSRTDEPLSLVLLDLDDFKRVNDTHGHAAGDDVLRACVQSWNTQLRARDTLARLGGDEFAVLLVGSSGEDADRIVSRLLCETPGEVSCSSGIATWDGDEDDSVLMSRADRDLYADKPRSPPAGPAERAGRSTRTDP